MNDSTPNDLSDLEHQLADSERRLLQLDTERENLLRQIESLRSELQPFPTETPSMSHNTTAAITQDSPMHEKLALFRRLFCGRDDVFARRWENTKTGKSGYQPACGNEWAHGLCNKPKIKCGECPNQSWVPFTDEVILNHLRGYDAGETSTRFKRDFTAGIYPMLQDETCRLLALDFDKDTWQEDTLAFKETCHTYDISAGLERSRSGNGAHIWIFFAEAIPASLARKLGNSLFVDDHFAPYPDQIAFLSSIKPVSKEEVAAIIQHAEREGNILGVRVVLEDEDYDEPWTLPPSRKQIELPLAASSFPKVVNIVLGNQIYLEKEGLPPSLLNRLHRLAAFQNPEFYKTQAMRLSTFGKPRIICCAEDFTKHIGLPRGCLDEVVSLLASLGIEPRMTDERSLGKPIDVVFQGILRPEQQVAARKILEQDNGVLSAATAFGKTVIAAHVIAARGVSTLVLVHRQQLLDQWIARLSEFLGIDPKRIGRIGGGKRNPTGFIDVALIQSLCRKGIVDDVVAEYGHLIVDECHHLSASSFEKVAKECKAKYVTGLSATVIRKDGHHPIIFMQCGPVRYRADARKQASLRPFEHLVIIRQTLFKMDRSVENPAIHDIYSALIADQARNVMIIDDVIAAVEERRSPVVITERREHMELLASELSKAVRNVIVLSGGMGVKQRRAIAKQLSDIPDGEESARCHREISW